MTTGSGGVGAGGSKKAEKSALGVLYTGYLEKLNPDAVFTDKVKRRFVVLTHVGLHWFKREEGYDLFGEEKGYILVQEIKSVAQDQQQPNQFQIETTEFVRRVFRASSKQECEQWVAAIHCAIKNRFMYRRETLTGLSFLPMGAETTRPNILLASIVHGDNNDQNGGGQEVVFTRGLNYGKVVSGLPRLEVTDRVVFTLADGSTASLEAKELEGGPKQVKARLSGALSGHLLCSVSPDSFKLSGGDATESPAWHRLVNVLLRTDTIISVALIAFLITICVADTTPEGGGFTLTIDPTSFLQLERAAILITILALTTQILLPLLFPSTSSWSSSSSTPRTPFTPRSPFLSPSVVKKPVALVAPLTMKVEDYVVERVDRHGGGGGEEPARPIPKRFIDGMGGDMTEALRRWKATLEWRKTYGTDTMLDEPVPYYDLIKECYPHYYCMAGRDGDPVYIERSGQVDQPRLRAAGCTVDMMVRHYVWATEFLYTHLHPRETAKTITLFDVKSVGIMDLAGDAFDFLRKSSSVIQEHYPERAKVIMIVNAPGWFSFLWKMIKPFVHENTQKKVKILKGGKETFEGVSEFVEPKNIPVEYGGELKFGDEEDTCRWKSPEEVKMRDYALAVNKRHGVEMIKG